MLARLTVSQVTVRPANFSSSKGASASPQLGCSVHQYARTGSRDHHTTVPVLLGSPGYQDILLHADSVIL